MSFHVLVHCKYIAEMCFTLLLELEITGVIDEKLISNGTNIDSDMRGDWNIEKTATLNMMINNNN